MNWPKAGVNSTRELVECLEQVMDELGRHE
jgi:hypothetical protein